jgi:hypothetical protein
MMTKLIAALTLSAVATVSFPLTIDAARLYNELSIPITACSTTDQAPTPNGWCFFMIGSPNHDDIQVDPHSESYSFDRNWTAVRVYGGPDFSGPPPLCELGFGPHYQLQGGNYMVVSSCGARCTACVVCDSNHNPIAGAGNC